jgi:hypothetical protein
VLIKVEKTINFWVEDINRKRAPVDGNVLWQKALSLYEDEKRKPSLLQQAEDGSISLQKGLISKTLKS